MPRKLLYGPLMAISLAALANGAYAAKAIKWEPSWKAAIEKAKSTNKVVMVDFYTEW